jgi:dUTP pyrophosphatase
MMPPKASSSLLHVAVMCFPHAEGLDLPRYATEGAAGLDLMAALPENMPIILEKNARALVPTGLALHLPSGYEAQIRPRSGLALKHGITVLNSPGTVDSDFRGELQVLLVNLGSEPFRLERGQRIAQLVVAPVQQVVLVEVSHLEETRRGTGGYGSTGV